LDLGSIIAGTYPGSLLAELGADVIKVESTDGDVVRGFAPTFVGYNKGKRGVSIDLRSAAGLAAFYALVKTADVVIDNYRPGVLQKLKVHYDDLVKVNPSIISVSVTGFGEAGPMRDDSGFDPLVQALSGMMQAQGGGEDPVFYAMPVNDVSSAAMAALGACLALLHRDRTGEGQRVWTSLAAMGAMMQSGELVRYEGRQAALEGGKDFAGPSALDRYYRSSDGWVRLQADEPGATRRLVEAEMVETIPKEPGDTFTDMEKWLTGWFAGMTSAEAAERLTLAGVPAVVARSLEELSRDDSLGEADVVHLHQPGRGVDFYAAGRFARLSRTEKAGVLDPPGLGEHSREVLAEAGLGDDEIETLIDDGVVVAGEPFVIWGGRSM